MLQQNFSEVISIIKKSRDTAIKAVNKELIDLYWNIGKYIYNRVETAEWGQSVVKELANYIKKNEPELSGVSDKNLWRMKQFYEIYKDFPKLSILLREISWTNNLIILSRTTSIEEKEFYINLARKEKYSKRELDRQISSSFFQRTTINSTKLSPVAREIYPNANQHFKDEYIFEFLNLKEPYSESGFQKELINQMKNLF